jgi:hypothetical protein
LDDQVQKIFHNIEINFTIENYSDPGLFPKALKLGKMGSSKRCFHHKNKGETQYD